MVAAAVGILARWTAVSGEYNERTRRPDARGRVAGPGRADDPGRPRIAVAVDVPERPAVGRRPATASHDDQREPRGVLRIKTPEGVRQVAYGYLLTPYAIRKHP